MVKTIGRTLDPGQIQKYIFDREKAAWRVISLNPLIPNDYDDIQLTYVTAGNGVGEIETITYLKDGSNVAILTLSYNGDNKLTRVQRTS